MNFCANRLRWYFPCPLIALSLCVSLLAGCGSSSKVISTTSPTVAAESRGAAVFTIHWPKRTTTRLIPLASNSIGIVVVDANGKTEGSQIIARPTSGDATSTVNFSNLETGPGTVIATAYPNADGSGVAQAHGALQVTVVAGQSTPVSLTMNSTIANVTVTPSTPSVVVGSTATLMATAYDASGAVVLTTDATWNWTSSNTRLASISGSGAQVTIAALAAGTVQISAVDSESGVLGQSLVTIPAHGPGLAASAWPKYHGNLQNTGVGIGQGAKGVFKGKLLLDNTPGSYSFYAPSIGPDGRIYVTTEEGGLYAINPDMTLAWKYTTSAKIETSPAIGADSVIYISDLQFVYAINPDGTLKWKYALASTSYASLSLGADGTVYSSSGNHLNALNNDGTLKWRYPITSVASSPAVGTDGTIYVGADDDYLYAINADGTLRWKYKDSSSLDASATIGPDGTIYCTTADNYLCAVNANGTLRWRTAVTALYINCPVVGNDGTVYIFSTNYNNDNLLAYHPDGTLKWTYPVEFPQGDSPAIGADGTIYVASDVGPFYAINPDGTAKWTYQGSYYASGPAISADGTLYALIENSQSPSSLYAIQ